MVSCKFCLPGLYLSGLKIHYTYMGGKLPLNISNLPHYLTFHYMK